MLSSAHFLRYRKRRLRREMVVRRSRLKLSVEHTVDAYLAALRPLGIKAQMTPPVIGLPQEAYQFADKFISQFSAVKHIIAFCPGARHFEKRWPAEAFRKLAESLLNDPNCGIIVFSAADDDFSPNLDIVHPRLLAAKNLSLLDAAALLSRCKVALTNDSGLMHLANAAGTPVLAIFGPTNPRLGFAPTLSGSQIICDDVACSPCSVHGQRPCYQPAKYCFEKITPERVASELQKMI
jgi:ADP-heptose:LPS heptosyltransferase